MKATGLCAAIVLGIAAILAGDQQAATDGASALRVPDAVEFVGAPEGTPIAGQQLDRRTAEISALLRCPVCQGLAVADSPAEMAVNMKGQVRELLARGFTEEQILRYFERSYGEFVLLRPKFRGVNALVWLLPVLALLAGLMLVAVKVRKLESPPAVAAPPDDEYDDEYAKRVRALVKGE